MSKRQFKSQASSNRVDSSAGFGGFGTVFAGSTLSYLSEPPNLSSITDANVVVAFKNLLKKDSTTKAKGLEDLRSFVQSHPYEQDGGVEQPILEAWVGYCVRKACKYAAIIIKSIGQIISSPLNRQFSPCA
jgi:E3 ubiquitin-protein ligase listerin